MKGQRFGRWTVLGQMEFSKTGERKWLCRCDCGTERFVLERSLLYGGSQSCGCLRKERAKEAVSADLTGKAFGELTVLGPAPAQKAGGVRWLCRCICGTEYTVLGTLLLSGRRTRCPNHRKNYAVKTLPDSAFSGSRRGTQRKHRTVEVSSGTAAATAELKLTYRTTTWFMEI